MIWPITSAFDIAADPFLELRRMQEEMNRLFRSGPREVAGYPALNVRTREDGVEVIAAVPGLEPKDLSLTVEGRLLAIEGERKEEEATAPAIRRERFAGRFSRQVRLPFDVDAGRVTAKYERGLVWITLPRSEQSKPRKIAVQAA